MLSPDCLCRKVASKGDGKQELVDGTGPVNQNKGASWNFQISFYTPYHIMSKYSSSICELNCVFPRRHKANELSSFPFRFHFTCPITSCLNISICEFNCVFPRRHLYSNQNAQAQSQRIVATRETALPCRHIWHRGKLQKVGSAFLLLPSASVAW